MTQRHDWYLESRIGFLNNAAKHKGPDPMTSLEQDDVMQRKKKKKILQKEMNGEFMVALHMAPMAAIAAASARWLARISPHLH